MYKCFACGKEIEHPGDSCPFCRFPVISTLHGDKDEEEKIREFAAEYRITNPQYFTAPEVKTQKISQSVQTTASQAAVKKAAVSPNVQNVSAARSAAQKTATVIPGTQSTGQVRQGTQSNAQPRPTAQNTARPKPTTQPTVAVRPNTQGYGSIEAPEQNQTKKKKSHAGIWILVLLIGMAGGYLFATQILPRFQSTAKPAANTAAAAQTSEADSSDKQDAAASTDTAAASSGHIFC